MTHMLQPLDYFEMRRSLLRFRFVGQKYRLESKKNITNNEMYDFVMMSSYYFS